LWQKTKMIKLSYSSLNNLHNGHEWLNKQMGIPVPDYHFLKEGRENQRPIQLHIVGKKEHPFLKNVKVRFPIVEEKDFDERCKFEFNFNKILVEYGIKEKLKDTYLIRGYYDAVDMPHRRFGEIKLSGTPMTMGKYQKSNQRKIYALSNKIFKEAILITGLRQVEKWKDKPLNALALPLTNKDRIEAIEWILAGIRILEKGDFTGGLDKNGKCTGCFWNMERYSHLANCNFL